MASSEDEKVPAAPSALESVTEKTAEDHTGDKSPNQQLKTDEVNKTVEEEVPEASNLSREDVPSPALVSQGPTEPKQDIQAEELPAETVEAGPEAAVPAEISDGEEIKQEDTETQEEKTEDGLSQVTTEETESVKTEEKREADTEEKAEDEPDKAEMVLEEETQEEEPQHKTTEDQAEGADLDRIADSIDANVIDAASVDVTPSDALSEQEPVKSQLEENHRDETPEGTEQPEPHVEADASGPTESTNETVDEARDTGEDSEPCKYVPAMANEDENTSQDGVSVLESETVSEGKIDHGSPATIKPDVESDSGSSSAADSNSLDLNLSISSFLTKTKEGNSISLQVMLCTSHARCLYLITTPEIPGMSLHFFEGVKASEEDSEEDAQIHGGRRRSQRDNLKDSDRQWCQKRRDEVPEVSCLPS